MSRHGTMRTLIAAPVGVLALMLLLLFRSPAVAGSDAFQNGWSAYDRGDYGRAIEFWLPLAQQGHVNAQINLAVMYDHGVGVTQDTGRALNWYRTAAHQDSAIAQYNLGLFLADRNIAAQEEDNALYWLLRSAAQGYADAQYHLGLMYAEGAAGKARIDDAPRWLYQAGLNYLSNDDGSGARSAVSALQEITSAQHLARQLEARLATWSQPVEDHFADAFETSLSTGTAWPVAAGYALTNHHVVSGKQSITLIDNQGREIAASLVASDEVNDIALLSVDDPARLPPALPLAASGARLGSSVFTIGFPRVDVMGTTPKLSQGIISGINGLRDDPASYQISVTIQPGNSGGPLLNMRGQVVGLITSMLGSLASGDAEAQPIPNIGYALKAERIAEFLRSAPQQPGSERLAELNSGHASLEALAHRIQNSVMIVRAETSLSP